MTKEDKNQMNFPNWIEAVANMAGLSCQKLSDALVAVRYELPGGRKQLVWVSAVGQDENDHHIINISSPALKMGAGQYIPRKVANDLLRQNARFLHGAWAIENIEGDDYLVMMDTQIAQTMDTEEFAASVQATAAKADELEQKLDLDRF